MQVSLRYNNTRSPVFFPLSVLYFLEMPEKGVFTMNLKKALLTLCATVALLAAPQTMDAAIFQPERNPFGQPITVHANGRYIVSDTQPVLQNNRVLLPMRAAAEAIGASVEWHSDNNCITVQKDSNTACFYVGNHTYTLNGVQKYTDVAPTVQNSRTLLPIRAFAEALNAHVEWNANLYDVEITIPGTYQTTPTIPSGLPTNLHNIVQKYYVPPTKPGIGSWWTTYSASGEYYYEMLFVSELPNGNRQAIEVCAKDVNSDGTPDFATIWTNPVTDFGNHMIHHRIGMDAQIYNSDTFLGPYVMTYPGNETFSYGSTYNPNDLIRIQSIPDTPHCYQQDIFQIITN